MDIFSKKSSTQDNVTRDSVSNDASTQPVMAQSPQATMNQPIVKKEKHSKAFSFVSILFLLTLLGAGFLAYLWYNQTADVESLNRELTQAKVDQDVLKKQVANLKQDSKTVPVSETVPTTDTVAITEIATAHYYAEVAVKNPDSNLKITVSKLELPFARVSVAGSSNGVSCIFKKVGDTWTLLYCTQAQTAETQDMDKRYGVPESIIRS